MEYRVKRGVGKKDGVEVLRWRLELPLYGELETITAFYEEIGARVEAFCRSTLSEQATEAYEVCEDPRKRFHYAPWSYRLAVRETAREKDLLSLSLEITQRAGDSVKAHALFGHVFCESEQILLSPREIERRVWGQRGSRASWKKRDGKMILSNPGICVERDGVWILLPMPKKENKKTKNS